MSKIRAVFSALARIPFAMWTAVVAVVLFGGMLGWAVMQVHPVHDVLASTITATPFDTATIAGTDTPTVDPAATATPLLGPTNTPDPLATATPSPPPTPTPTIESYQAPLLPVEITLSPTTMNGVCAEGQLPKIAVTQDGGTDPMGWGASASPHVDLNPGSSSANGNNPMVPGQAQYIGFSFGPAFPAGTTITITVQQTQMTVPSQTQVVGTVTVHCQ